MTWPLERCASRYGALAPRTRLAVGRGLLLAGPFTYVALVVAIGPSPVGHVEHFLGFVFGSAVEGISVLSEEEFARFRKEQRQSRDLMHER